ncbi:hypothetical protein FSP39_015203 [Pinctada imbricata]|uniref:Uncharacterized protein n=1 Tax=Pinctada imbricata TaxID=66713 RepID=A0AA88XFU9_PINIB|nr:hypothetical protein FSP39_015203 [Pinctada imbricata]
MHSLSERTCKEIPPVINTNYWSEEDANLLSHKAPSTVLLKYPNHEFDSFGYEAESKFVTMIQEDASDCVNWSYVTEFKMYLNEKVDRNSSVEDMLGRPVKLKHVLACCIGYLNRHMQKDFATKGTGLEQKDIQYVLTVPAIWSDAAKQLMREAASDAGLDKTDIKLAYEPEAAALLCRSLSEKKLNGSLSTRTLFRTGVTFMVLDLGGGTADLTVQKIGADDRLVQVHKASGGSWGGTRVNHYYFGFMIDIFGKDVMRKFCRDHMIEYLFMLRNFEQKKRKVKLVNDEKHIDVRVPAELVETFRDVQGKELNAHIESKRLLAGKVVLKRNTLRVDVGIFKGFFSETLEGIVKHVKKILQKPDCSQVEFLLLVGGFSESPMANETLRNEFSNIPVITPIGSECGLAVLKGATIFGFDSNIVTSRVCPFTYGVALHKNLSVVLQQSPGQMTAPVDLGATFYAHGNIFATDVFHKFFTVNEIVPVGTKRSFSVRNMNTGSNLEGIEKSHKEIFIFSSKEENPNLITDPGCKIHGVLMVPPPVGGWPMKAEGEIEVEMGSTDILVRYIDKAKKYSITGTIDFLSNTELDAILRESSTDRTLRFQRQFELVLDSTS